MARILISLLFVVCLLACERRPTATPAPPAPTREPTPGADWRNPVYEQDFPDPFVLRVGDLYFAYATNGLGRNIQVLRSKDMRQWTLAGRNGEALPELPAWAAAWAGLTWAPSVLSAGGQYVLYYVARHVPSGLQCISYALSAAPDGPFVDPNPEPFICQQTGGGSIDPEPFVDADGTPYLLWKNDGNCCGLPVWLWAQRLSTDGRALVGESARLVAYDQPWERPLVENPSLALLAGRYVLLYSANDYAGRDYAVGYALCESPLGPCAKPQQGPLMASAGTQVGPGGASFARDATGDLWVAYHAWTEPVVGYPGGKRSLHLGRVQWRDDRPVIYRPEAQ